MKQQITMFEFIRLLVALLASIVIHVVASLIADSVTDEPLGWLSTIVHLLLASFLPAFLAVFLATFLPSWRYKLIAATLILSGITLWGILWGIRDVAGYLFGFWGSHSPLIRFSLSVSGALVALSVWMQWKLNWVKGEQTVVAIVETAPKIPQTSPILLGLSLISIPIAYVTLFASSFLVLGYSALLFFLLAGVPGGPILPLAPLRIAAVIAPIIAGWITLRAFGAQLVGLPEFIPAHTIPWMKRTRFRQMVEEVCHAIGTRVPDNVVLHIRPTFFVTQQRIRTFDSEIQGRTLAIGLPLLPLLTRQELKAVLAHEFAHFSGRDTLYSIWVTPVFRSLGESIIQLQTTTGDAHNRWKYAINLLLMPSLQILLVFYEFFASIEAIISRSRELRADWIAASHYGSNSVVTALQKMVQYGAFFTEQQAQINLESEHHLKQHYRIDSLVDLYDLQGHLDKAMNAKESEFDRHPTLSTRIGNLSVSESEDHELNEDIQQELSEDEANLSALYAQMLKILNAHSTRR